MATIKATIFFEKRYWVGTFERIDKDGYAVARHIFGGEPSDIEDAKNARSQKPK